MGPSIKFVLAIIDSISNPKKMGADFFLKVRHEGGVSKGVMSWRHKQKPKLFLNIFLCLGVFEWLPRLD